MFRQNVKNSEPKADRFIPHRSTHEHHHTLCSHVQGEDMLMKTVTDIQREADALRVLVDEIDEYQRKSREREGLRTSLEVSLTHHYLLFRPLILIIQYEQRARAESEKLRRDVDGLQESVAKKDKSSARKEAMYADITVTL